MNLKQIYGSLLMTYSKLFGMDAAKKFDTRFRFHRKLNLKNPSTLADKVTYLELHCQSPLAPMCTDKYAVREYVSRKGLSDTLIPLAGGPWNSVEDVDFDNLPDQFAIKATHGCKMNYIVPDKSQMDMEHCKKVMQEWLNTTYGTYSMEPHYLEIPHRLYAEEFLENADSLVDYKFHCLNGLPQFVLVCSNRRVLQNGKMAVTLDLFDMDWNHVPVICPDGNEVPGNGKIEKPESFAEMKRMAEKLSQDFDFVRVDLYEVNGGIRFGELTFSPACCVFPYFSEAFVEQMGSKLTIHK